LGKCDPREVEPIREWFGIGCGNEPGFILHVGDDDRHVEMILVSLNDLAQPCRQHSRAALVCIEQKKDERRV